MRVLLDNGARPSKREDTLGWTPLHLAAVGSHYKVARLLLRHARTARASGRRGRAFRPHRATDRVGDTPFDCVPRPRKSGSAKERERRRRRRARGHPPTKADIAADKAVATFRKLKQLLRDGYAAKKGAAKGRRGADASSDGASDSDEAIETLKRGGGRKKKKGGGKAPKTLLEAGDRIAEEEEDDEEDSWDAGHGGGGKKAKRQTSSLADVARGRKPTSPSGRSKKEIAASLRDIAESYDDDDFE